MTTEKSPVQVVENDFDSEDLGLLDVMLPLVQQLKLLILAPLLIGVVTLGVAYLLPQTFTSTTKILPPQQQRSSVAASLAQLGALSGLAGAAAGIRNPADQYVALLQSTKIADRLVDDFKLMQVYKVTYRFEARQTLASNSRIAMGRKDGLITIEVDDHDPQRASDMANHYVDELRRLTGELALTEAQQRRAFFEKQLLQTRDRLTVAQRALQTSGLSAGALRTDARVAVEGYARLRAEATAAEVRARILRQQMTDDAPEVRQALATVEALRAQLSKQESPIDPTGNGDYVGKFREFKYQEALFDLFARQFELARLDESNDGALIQVVDSATPAEWKSKPKRGYLAVVATALSFSTLLALVLLRHFWRQAAERPATASKIARLRGALRSRGG